ncbi:MAG: response regulator [Myxococcales bacterium]|nr:response regulator [Myxococcales bacterium]
MDARPSRGFAEQHPDPVLRVALGGDAMTLVWGNRAARDWMARAGARVGDPIPVHLRDELSARVGSGAVRGVLVSGDRDEPVWEFVVTGGDEPAIWLHARSPDDSVGDQVRSARQAKSAFLANTSHELRTPLNAILGYTGLLREDRPDDPDLVRIETAAHHLRALIDELLEVSRVEAGRIGLFVESFAVGSLASEVRDSVAPLAATRRISLRVEAPSERVVRADRAKLRQIVVQVLERAVRTAEHAELLVRWEVVEESLVVEVGAPGLSAAEARSSLEPEGAAGLGLVLARLLAELLGGTLTAQVGAEGTRYRLLAPVRPDVVEGPAEEAPAPPIQGPADASTLVLVVDDDAASRDLIARQLVREGFRVAAVADGEQGLIAARRIRPDVITLDLVMPRMDGWEVLRRLKADPVVGQIPVVVVSILDASGFGFALGASGFLTKPIDRRRLQSVLGPYRSESGRVLVVDDDPDQRDLMERALTRQGWTVLQASDGAVALDLLEHQLPNVILLDLFMPRVDGFQVVDAVRSRPAWRNVPIVVVTAMELVPADHERLANRVQAVLAKRGQSTLERLVDEIAAVARKGPGPTT